jgi:Ca2+-binding RTX toxin-like protein
MDGTVWNQGDIYTSVISATEENDTLYDIAQTDYLNGLGGNDVLHGLDGDDVIQGGPGNDRIHGESGDDVIQGGPGNDTLFGGNGTVYWRPQYSNGSDTYIFNLGDGHDIIEDYDRTASNIDVVEFGTGIDATNLQLQIVDRDDLLITITDTGDTITVRDWKRSQGPHYGIDAIRFSDGTEWDTDDIENALLIGGPGDDTIYAFRDDDILQGNGGADRLFGSSGNDRIFGGGDNDILDGGTGRDSLRSLRSNDYALAA